MNRISRTRFEKGQSMIMGIIAMLILLIAIFFLVDIHSVIRVKVKAQTAADAAALTAANWQRHSLNTIGELNLLKACTVLVETVFPGDPDPLKNTDPVKIEIAADILTEMQSRIAFVGPMIGFGAAQQAAKNNGMNSDPHYNSTVFRHIENLLDDNFYGKDPPASIPPIIPIPDADGRGGYDWRTPYMDMVESVYDNGKGVAAAPNVDFASLPNVTPAWLMDLGLYDAIAGKYWCYGSLRSFVKAPYQINGNLIDYSNNVSSFPEESEYTPIYIDYSEANRDVSAQYFIDAGPEDGGVLDTQERGIGLSVAAYDLTRSGVPPSFSNFPEIRWCIYESRWDNGPSDSWTTWHPSRDSSGKEKNRYLRSPLKPEYVYGGAVAKMTCVVSPEVAMSRGYEVIKKPNQREKLLKGFDTTDDPNQKGSWIIPTTDSHSKPIAPLKIKCSALAKPLGSLPGGNTPNSVKMVLPVFNQSVLIPVAMQDPTGLYDPFNEDQYNLFIFLKWLKDNNIVVGKIDDTIPPDCPNIFFMECLQKLNTPSWTNEGFRIPIPSDFDVDGIITIIDYNKNVGWLQRVGYDLDASGNIATPPSVYTYESRCYSHPGGDGGNPDGPSILH